MSVVFNCTNESDLLSIPSDIMLQDATNWETNALAQMWRMFNERLLINGMLLTWTPSGVRVYSIEDILPVVPVVVGDKSGWTMDFTRDNPDAAAKGNYLVAFDDVAIIEAGANLQDMRVWLYMQSWIENRSFLWYNSNKNKTYTFDDLLQESDLPYGYRRYTHDGSLIYGKIQTGDLIGPWLIADIVKLLSLLRIPKSSTNKIYDDDFYTNTYFNTINYLYFGWKTSMPTQRVNNYIGNAVAKQNELIQNTPQVLELAYASEMLISYGQFWRSAFTAIEGYDILVYSTYEHAPVIPYLMLSSTTYGILNAYKSAYLYYGIAESLTSDPATQINLPFGGWSAPFLDGYVENNTPFQFTKELHSAIYSDYANIKLQETPISLPFPNIDDPTNSGTDTAKWGVRINDSWIIPNFTVKGTLGDIHVVLS